MSFCMGYSSFIALLRISISRILDHNFKTKMTFGNNNNRPFPFLRTLHVFYENFIEFGCGRILHRFGTVSRFAVHEVKQFQKSDKFAWRTRDEIKFKILYLFEYLEVVFCRHYSSLELKISFLEL